MIEKIPFGRTGHNSSRVIFGAAALWQDDEVAAQKTLDLILSYGINHIDVAASYGDAEINVGRWMAQHRGDFFLASKTGEREYAAAYAEIQRSLERLQVDQLDLIQLHNLVDPEAWQTALAPGGALEAAIEARDKGYVRFIGVTGHGLSVAARPQLSLDRFAFDSILTPYNYNFMQIAQYKADFDALQTMCVERGVAMQTIKSIARGRWGDQERTRTTWYQPLEGQRDIESGVAYVLQRKGVFLNSTGDVNLLPKVLEAAAKFSAEPTDSAETEAHLATVDLQPLFVESDKI